MSRLLFALALSLFLFGCPPAADDATTDPFAGSMDDDDAADDDDAVSDDDDATWGDDDDAWDDDDVSDDDDNAWDDDDAAPDDDDAVSDDDDVSGDDDDDDTVTEDDDDTLDDEVCDEAFEAPQTKFLSADDSNSQADPAHNRQMLLDHQVAVDTAKPWEYLNYYGFDYEPAEPGHVRIEPQLVQGADGSYDMLVAVVAPQIDPADRMPLNLVFSVDASGSMGGDGIAAAKASMYAIANSLMSGDVVSMVTWDTTNNVELDSYAVSGPNDSTLLATIDGITTGGSTNLNSGLVAAYDLANGNYDPSRVNRVVLISDGGANVGTTQADLIAASAEDGESEGIYLLGIGTPPAWYYNDELMDEVTDLGKGGYYYVDTEAEAESRFSYELIPGVFQVASRDVQLAVTLPPGFVVEEFTGEEMSSNPAEVEPQHLSVNDQMLYDLDLLDCSVDSGSPELEFLFTVEWEDPATGTPMIDTLSMSVADMLAADSRELYKAAALVSFAQAFAEVNDLSTATSKRAHLQDVIDQLNSAIVAFPTDPDLPEVLDLAQTWQDLY